MYYPYFRGKQNELLTVRDMAETMSHSEIIPIIEPVKEKPGNLSNALAAISKAEGKAILIVNPRYGALINSGISLSKFLEEHFSKNENISAGIIIDETSQIDEIIKVCKKYSKFSPSLIHSGFTHGKTLADQLGDEDYDARHIFIDRHCGNLYYAHFSQNRRTILTDGFKRKNNADYSKVERFSDANVVFKSMGMDGFGDFLIVGDAFKEGGGQAYAVAIHITFINPLDQNIIYIYHFISDSNTTTANVAGKFLEALKKLIAVLDSKKSMIFEGETIKEFRDLYKRKHYPGLGYLKKLSMNQHIETVANYLK